MVSDEWSVLIVISCWLIADYGLRTNRVDQRDRQSVSGFVTILLFGVASSAVAKDAVFIGTSINTLAGFYRSQPAVFLLFSQSLAIAPDGKVTLKVRNSGE